MADQVEREIIRRGERGMVLVGHMHAFMHYRQPLVRDGKFVHEMRLRMAHMLHDGFGDRVFQITFHLHKASPIVFDPTYQGEQPVIVDVIEQVMERTENAPVGFDVFASPLATLRDSRSCYFHYQPEVVLKDVCRGYVFLAPWKTLRRCEWVEGFISDEMFAENEDFYEAKLGRSFASADEMNQFFASLAGGGVGR